MSYFSRRCCRLLLVTIVITAVIFGPLPSPLSDGSASAFSVGEEREVGEKLLAIVRKEFKVIDDPDVVQYINRVGGEILHAAGPQFFDYHFFIVDDKEFNAFAAPSGLIFIHSGLIKTMTSEGELLSVIAHEVGHAASRHIADRIAKSAKVNAGTAALALAGIVLGAGPISEALITGSLAAGTTLNLKFSRQDEEEADRLAYKYLQEMKRDPASMVSMLRKMYRIDRYRRGKVPAYLLTHPEPALRLNYVQDLLLMENESIQYRAEDQFAFQRMKCRVLAISEEPTTLLPAFQQQAADSASTQDQRVMGLYGVSLLKLASADFNAASDSLAKVMAYYPDKTVLTTDLAVIHAEAGRYDQALPLFQQAHTADPNCAYTKYNLARVLWHLGRLSEAARLYEELLAEMPDNADLHYQLGKIAADLGDRAAGYYHLGVYHWYGGNAEMAKRHLHQAIQELPEGRAEKKMARDLLATIDRVEHR
ncbi:MAG: M48 family metalloprotease [Desulfobulbaceae bacterium]|nr:M48 family metalloprotease [Desulfobulbaceae bacterium]